jgi:hypothetical protein
VAAGAGCCGVVRGGIGLGGGAVTVIAGTGVAPGGVGGVSGGACWAGGGLAGVSLDGAAGALGAAGVAGAGAGEVGAAGVGVGAAGGAGAGVGAGAAGGAGCGEVGCGDCGCDGAIVSMQFSQNSDELLRRSKRLLRLHIPDPRSFSCENVPSHRLCSAISASDAPTRMRSSDGRCAGGKECRGRGDPAKFHRRVRAPSPKNKRQWDGRRVRQSNSAGQMHDCTDRTIVVCAIRTVVVCGSGCVAIRRLDCRRGLRTNPVEVHMSERDDELERERNQRDVRTQLQTHSKPAHDPGRSTRPHSLHDRANFSYIVTFPQSARLRLIGTVAKNHRWAGYAHM